jgi:hypothetical protein
MSTVSARAQVNYRPTPPPVVTAENERWYLEGEPVMFAGIIYYPAGPQTHFNGFEMVRSGFFRGVPLYTRTTIEPYSLVFVPLSGGLMQPYERRRDGDVAGTVGSTTPSFPVVRSSESTVDVLPEAAGPPGPEAIILPPAPAGVAVRVAVAPPTASAAVGTAGRAPVAVPPANPPRRLAAPNALYLDFDGRRWYPSGSAVPLDSKRMQRIGEHHGFAIYADAPHDPGAIYVQVTRESQDYVARYSRRPSR